MSPPRLWARIAVPAPALLLSLACAAPSAVVRFQFFSPASPGDPWFDKVAAWQARALEANDARGGAADLISPPPRTAAPPELSGSLRVKMGSFEADQKRALARRINSWAQVQARKHYRFEPDVEDPTLDRWPTLQELLAQNGDDCDGLDLITYQLLLEFGFPRDELYRAVVRRDRDRANHMVTLWFENRADPWILDATGAMTLEMVRFSEIVGWTPTQVFNERHQFHAASSVGPLEVAGP